MYKKSYLLREGARIIDAIRVLNNSNSGLVLVVDSSEHLLGVMTDGDIRRGLLRGVGLQDSIESVLFTKCFTVSLGTSRDQVLDIMRARKIAQVPVVNEDNKVVGLHLLNRLISSSSLPNVAVIMAGGKGERLGALTKSIPKPMLKVAGRPILERIILHLISHGISHVYLAVNYLRDIIKTYFGDGSWLGCQIEYLEEEKPLGSGGPLSLLPPQKHGVVVMNGDLITDVNISRMIEYHEQHGFYATMGHTTYQHTVPFGCVEVKDGMVTQIVEKPTIIKNANAGIYVISPEAVALVPKNQYFMITDIFGAALNSGKKCGAYPVGSDWIDVGQPHDLERARGA